MASSKWNLEMVRAREACDLLRERRPGPDGQVDWGEIEVGHIDTGCTRHAVFGPWQGDRSGILLVEDGLNLLERGELPFDPLNYEGNPAHGTRTCSVLCGDLADTFVGIAPGVPTIPYRAVRSVVVSSKKSRKRVAKAIYHAVDENGVEVLSISLGFPQMSLFGQRHLGKAVDHAYRNGVIVVAAGGQVIDRVTYPGKFSRTIGVGGVSANRKAWFKYDQGSARRSIDIWGPADDVLGANSELDGGQVVEASYWTGKGTSYATAHVAGAAAMWLAYHGDELDNAYLEPWQRIEAFRRLIAQTGRDLKGDYWPDETKGILDIRALLKADLPAAASLEFEKRKAEDEIF